MRICVFVGMVNLTVDNKKKEQPSGEKEGKKEAEKQAWDKNKGRKCG